MVKGRISIIPKPRLAMLQVNEREQRESGCTLINAHLEMGGTFQDCIKRRQTAMAQPQNDPNNAGWPRGHGGGTGPSGGGRGNNNPRK
jgi:hypothetical protein